MARGTPAPGWEPSINELSTALLVTDDQLRVRFFNQAAVEATGIRPDPGADLASLGPVGQALHPAAERALARTETILQRLSTTPGIDHALDAVFSPQTQPNRLRIEITPVPGSQHDETRQERWRQEALGRFTRSLAHEIKNPLGGMRGAAQLLAADLDPRQREYTDVIVSEVDRLHRLVDSLQAGASARPRQPVNLFRPLERVRQLLQAQYPQLAVERDYDPSLPLVQGDPDALVQGLLNLAINAGQAGASRVVLRTRVRRAALVDGAAPASAIAVEIEDDGCGVSDELRSLLFVPLVSGSGGTGMGLAIAQRLAREHGGLVRLERPKDPTVMQWLLPLPP